MLIDIIELFIIGATVSFALIGCCIVIFKISDKRKGGD
jgi:hypothetical protein